MVVMPPFCTMVVYVEGFSDIGVGVIGMLVIYVGSISGGLVAFMEGTVILYDDYQGGYGK